MSQPMTDYLKAAERLAAYACRADCPQEVANNIEAVFCEVDRLKGELAEETIWKETFAGTAEKQVESMRQMGERLTAERDAALAEVERLRNERSRP